MERNVETYFHKLLINNEFNEIMEMGNGKWEMGNGKNLKKIKNLGGGQTRGVKIEKGGVRRWFTASYVHLTQIQ